MSSWKSAKSEPLLAANQKHSRFRGSNLLDTLMIPKPQSGEKLAVFPVKAEETERMVQSPVNITDLK